MDVRYSRARAGLDIYHLKRIDNTYNEAQLIRIVFLMHEITSHHLILSEPEVILNTDR